MASLGAVPLLLLAAALGAAVGWERQRRDHPAGLRTHILVCVGAALMTLVDRYSDDAHGRIAAQIVTGVGFLGAGTIIRAQEGPSVRGLTTAASVWAIAGVGIAVGYGGFAADLAVIATILILLTLTVINQLEETLLKHRRHQELRLVFADDGSALTVVQELTGRLRKRDIQIRDFRLEAMAGAVTARLRLRLPHGLHREEIEALLPWDSGIVHAEWDD